MSPLRMAAMTSGASSSSGCSRGWVTGVHGVSRRSAWPGTRTMSHRSWRSSSPGTSKMSSSSAASEAVICSRIGGAHRGADLDAHDLAEAAAAQLVLDRAHEVVGLVGDREVGVARDPEDRVVDDLHPGEQRREVLGDQVLERDERAPVADRHEARQHLLRHLHAREGLDPADRVADDDAERQREVGDVGERPPEADRQRRQHREDLAAEALVERLALLRADLVDADDADAVLGQRRAQVAVEHRRLALEVLAHRRADQLDRLARRAPVLQRRLDPGVDLVVQARDADHEELVEVRGGDRAELHALQQRRAPGPRRARARAS